MLCGGIFRGVVRRLRLYRLLLVTVIQRGVWGVSCCFGIGLESNRGNFPLGAVYIPAPTAGTPFEPAAAQGYRRAIVNSTSLVVVTSTTCV